MNQLQVMLIGSGEFGLEIAAASLHCKNLRIVGACDATPAAVESFVKTFGGRAYRRLEEGLEDKSVEGVLIVTPNDTHTALVEKAARAGKHIFVEKPIANAVADARAAIRAAAEAKVTLFVGHVARRSAQMRMARKMVDSGEFGKIILVEGHTAHNGGLRLRPEEWRWYRSRCPGGPLIQLAVHTVDTLEYLVGPARSVSAKVGRLATPAEIDDVGVMALEYENGALGYVGTAYTIPGSNFIHIYGTEAMLQADRYGGDFLVKYKDGRTETRAPLFTYNTLADELDEFAACARTGKRPETGGEEGLQALAVILAAIKSAETGRSVTIKEILGEA